MFLIRGRERKNCRIKKIVTVYLVEMTRLSVFIEMNPGSPVIAKTKV